MKSNDMITKIKEVLNLTEEVKLEQLKLENGTILEDGRSLIVEEVGLIAEIKAEEEEKEEVEAAEHKEEEMQYVTKEEFRKEMDELKKHIKDLMDHKDKEKMSADDLGNLITEELSKQEIPDEVQVELNKPAAEPIKANPEAGTNNIGKFTWGKNRKKTTADRVMEKILNINN